MNLDFEHFRFLREAMHELQKLKNKEEQLISQISEQEKRILKLEVELDMENEDVEKLTSMSLKYLFYTILRSKEEQLNKERREVLEATLRLQEAKFALDDYKSELSNTKDKIIELSMIPDQYDELMRRKEILLKSHSASALKLEEMDNEIFNLSILLKDINEALQEGKGIHSLLTDASKSLEKAEDWGNWDLWFNGGMFSTYIKHGHIDDARSFTHSANRQMERFQKELADLKQSVDLQIDISGILTMADYLFDGLIVDWIVQGKIENAQNNTLQALRKVEPIVTQLEREAHTTELQLESLKQKRISWIEQIEYER